MAKSKNLIKQSNMISQCCNSKVGLYLNKMYYVCLKCLKRYLIKNENTK